MNDPYSVLGISPSASNDEVKKAYREMSRKYHPDNVANNPLKDLAEEKFKEVQEAYKQIMDMRANGGSAYGSYGTNTQSGYNGSQETMAMYNRVRMSLNSRRFSEALNMLNSINDRSAEWFYLSGVANAGIGNTMAAMDYAQRAVNMEPNNSEYRAFLSQLNMSTDRYRRDSMNGGRNTFGTGNICCDLWCLDTLCECMGGDLCSCM